jgi:hypothetical protein
MWKSRAVFLLAVSAAFTPLTASAAPVTVPAELNPGDQYRLAFVTSGTRNAISTDIADYNAFVTSAAGSVPELAALPTIWRAIASTEYAIGDEDHGFVIIQDHARDNTATNPEVSAGFPIYLLDNTKIATSNADFWDGSILAPFNRSETMGIIAGSVWTGTVADGQIDPDGNWHPLGPFHADATVGHTQYVNEGWILGGGLDPLNELHFYAVSGILTVPVPEPSAMILAILAATGLAVAAFQKHRRVA